MNCIKNEIYYGHCGLPIYYVKNEIIFPKKYLAFIFITIQKHSMINCIKKKISMINFIG
jgi:hypothetical protein